MKKRLLYVALACVLLLSLTCLVCCTDPAEGPDPIKLKDIDDITKGYFGDNTPPITVTLSDYVDKNGAEVSYAVSSSDSSVAEATVDGDKLTVALCKGTGTTKITVSVKNGDEEAFALSFTVHATSYPRIACIGDSLTYGHAWPEEAWPVYLGEKLGEDFTIGNFGKNGASICGYNPTGYIKYANLGEYYYSFDFEPDILIIMLGTNDAKDWAPAEPEFIQTYIELVASYRDEFPDLKILMVSAPPTMEDNCFSLPNDVICNHVVPAQRELAEILELPLLDLNAIMLSMEGGYDSMLRGDAAFDGVHLSVDGAKYVAELIAEAISKF